MEIQPIFTGFPNSYQSKYSPSGLKGIRTSWPVFRNTFRLNPLYYKTLFTLIELIINDRGYLGEHSSG